VLGRRAPVLGPNTAIRSRVRPPTDGAVRGVLRSAMSRSVNQAIVVSPRPARKPADPSVERSKRLADQLLGPGRRAYMIRVRTLDRSRGPARCPATAVKPVGTIFTIVASPPPRDHRVPQPRRVEPLLSAAAPDHAWPPAASVLPPRASTAGSDAARPRSADVQRFHLVSRPTIDLGGLPGDDRLAGPGRLSCEPDVSQRVRSTTGRVRHADGRSAATSVCPAPVA